MSKTVAKHRSKRGVKFKRLPEIISCIESCDRRNGAVINGAIVSEANRGSLEGGGSLSCYENLLKCFKREVSDDLENFHHLSCLL